MAKVLSKGTKVSVMGKGPGTIIGVHEDFNEYEVKLPNGKKIFVSFNLVKSITNEIKRMQQLAGLLKEIDVDSLLNSISSFNPNDSEGGINIGSNVAVMKYGPGIIVNIDDEKEEYTVELLSNKKEIKVPFAFVQPANLPEELPINILSQIEELRNEYEVFRRNVIGNLLSSNEEDDFSTEKYKLPGIVDFYFDLGKQLWDICKQYPQTVIYSDEFEELFLDILGDIVILNKLDQGEDEDLNKLLRAYRRIGDIIGADVI